MKLRGLAIGLFIGGLLTLALISLLYLGDQALGLPFVPFDLFDWITRTLPGPVITFGIDLMIDTMLLLQVNVADIAKTAEQIAAVIQFLLIGMVAAVILWAVLLRRGQSDSRLGGVLLGAMVGLPLIAISLTISQSTVNPLLSAAWLLLLFLGWGLILGLSYSKEASTRVQPEDDVGQEPRVERLSRRQFLVALGGGAATITVVGTSVGALLAGNNRRRLEAELAGSMAHLETGSDLSAFPNANDPVVPAPGTRPEYTPLKDHYKVFIRTEPTVIDGATWTLPITGLVDNPLMLTLDDIQSRYSSRDQYVTLSCISGRIGTTLISTTQWTGVSLQEVLAEAQVQPGARYLQITSGDGFYETVDLDLIASDERIMLTYAWDGNPLPVDHGFPLRIWIPDRFGMKQPKWITGMELIDEYREGYWVERNWDETAQVRATSVIDTVAADAVEEVGGQQLVPVGGIAFAGARGISAVEVRVNDGPWQEAQLRSPLSGTTWVIWRFDWPFEAGPHLFEVRCREGDGTPQIEAEMEARPSGSTGIHSRQATL